MYINIFVCICIYKHYPYHDQMVYDTISVKASMFSSEGGLKGSTFSSEGGANVEGGGQLDVLNEIKGIYLYLYAYLFT